MGVNTDAILFYGYVWNDETEIVDGEWERTICKKRGFVNPWDAYKEPEGLFYHQRQEYADKWAVEHEQEIDKWHGAKENVRKEFLCDIGYHCSGDYPIPYIYVKESETKANRGFPEKITDLTIKSDWKASLDKFVTELGINVTDMEDAWWLISYWG